MKSALVPLPFADFEARVMQQVQAEAAVRSSAAKDKRRAAIFFLLGNGSGLLIALFLYISRQQAGEPADITGWGVQLAFVLFLLLFGSQVVRKIRGRSMG